MVTDEKDVMIRFYLLVSGNKPRLDFVASNHPMYDNIENSMSIYKKKNFGTGIDQTFFSQPNKLRSLYEHLEQTNQKHYTGASI